MSYLSFYLLNVDKRAVSTLRPTTALDTFQGATKDFHENGLYSVLTFGPIGSERRDLTFSYVDVGIEIISPAIALTLFELKHLYKDIMSGKRYAIWDEKEKDFFPAAPTDKGASTGYSFFISKYKELKPKENKSLIRQQNIDLFNRFRDIALSRYVLVMPAGLRDMEVTPDGKNEREQDINKVYRRLISTASIVPTLGNTNTSALDPTRWSLQNTFNEIYKYFFDFADGKKGFIRGKWAARRLTNGTRNVLSSMDTSSVVMDRPDEMRPTDTVVGLFQGIKSLAPVAIHAIRTKYLPNTFGPDGTMYLVNKKTLKREVVFVTTEDYDKFSTDEGIEKLINQFRDNTIRHKEVTVQGHYLALIYNDGQEFKVFYDIADLPEGRDKKYVRGITYAELLYLSGHDIWNDYFTIVTRYPVAGQGSTYSSTIRLTTTTSVSMVWELNEDWATRREKPAIDFPNRSIPEFVSSMAPHSSRLAGLVADFDGDTGSGDSVYTDEALEENRNMMKKATYWVEGGRLTIDISGSGLVDRVMHNLLADPL